MEIFMATVKRGAASRSIHDSAFSMECAQSGTRTKEKHGHILIQHHFSPSSPQGGEDREEANVYKHEALAPFGRGEGVVSVITVSLCS